MSITDRDFDRLMNKLGFQTREGDHLFAWLELDGHVVLRTRRSHKRGDVPMQHAIRQQMKLSEQELSEAVSCTLGRDAYIAILKEKGLLSNAP